MENWEKSKKIPLGINYSKNVQVRCLFVDKKESRQGFALGKRAWKRMEKLKLQKNFVT